MGKFSTGVVYTLVAIAAVIGATLAVLPASVAAHAIAVGTNGQLRLTNLSGTAWTGRGDATIQPFAAGQAPLVVRNVDWTVRRWRFLLGELSLGLKFNGPEISGMADVTRSFGQIAARNVRASLPASLVSTNIPAARGWPTPGTVEVKAESLTFTSRGIDGSAELSWRGAEAAGIGAIGDYRALVKGNGQGPAKVDLTTVQGQIRLDGRGELSPSSDLQMTVNVDVQGPNRAMLMPILGFIGAARADGSIAIEVDSRKGARGGAPVKKSSVHGVGFYGYQSLPA